MLNLAAEVVDKPPLIVLLLLSLGLVSFCIVTGFYGWEMLYDTLSIYRRTRDLSEPLRALNKILCGIGLIVGTGVVVFALSLMLCGLWHLWIG